jgi:hypothetical protein
MAVDRHRMGEQLFRGFYTLGSPVCQAIQRWALPVDELTRRPGYRFTQQEREEDQAEARRLWEAAGGPGIEPFSEEKRDRFIVDGFVLFAAAGRRA